jgi:hypothetical protein
MAVESHDKKLSELLTWVGLGKAQLPEFQRSWVWDDTKICKLIESITSGFPMGAAMFLEGHGDSVRFKCRYFTGVKCSDDISPDWLVLDGQQRLTTLYQVFMCKKAVETRLDTSRDKTIFRYYYLDIRKCLDPEADRLEAIVSISDKKQILSDIGRTVVLDLSTQENEFEHLMFPLNLVFSPNEIDDWRFGMEEHFQNDSEHRLLFRDFSQKILRPIQDYQMPVIQLTKDTPKEAVCQIFENVNTGGVPLTVFELVTATFAADEYDLRADWNAIRRQFADKKLTVLKDITGANFLAAMTLLVTYKKSLVNESAVTCKKRDILRLELSDYKANHDALVVGFESAAAFLSHQGIYSERDLPYSSQLVPLAAIYAFDSEQKEKRPLMLSHNLDLLAKWYWCGVFGELYGGANEARFALDIANIFDWINNGSQPDTVTRSNFQPTRLLSMQTRNSAAYKGVMAMIMQDSPLDFMSGNKMDIASYLDEDTDIHHIFPQAYCEGVKLPMRKWNSVVNKTPIYASTNRSIGGRAPSEYIKTMKNKGLSDDQVVNAISSHKINYVLLSADDFDAYFVDRAIKLLNRIEKATGKSIAGRDSEETIREFGVALTKASES